MLCRITYGLTKDGEPVHISKAQRGLCSLVCPGCKKPLIAKKGEEVGHHFAHEDGGDCPNGYINSLYYAVGQQIARLGGITVPAYMKNRSLVEEGSGTHVITPERFVKLHDVAFTWKGGEQITGILAYCGKRPLIIRLLTGYSGGSGDSSQIKKNGFPLLEIDLGRDDEINDSRIQHMLLKAPDNVYWKYNEKAEDIWRTMLGKCVKLPVGKRDGALFTYGCPIDKNRREGVYCYIAEKCARCPFFFGLGGFEEERFLYCGRQNRITEPEDIGLDMESRKEKYRKFG